jgi:hypothetical protein
MMPEGVANASRCYAATHGCGHTGVTLRRRIFLKRSEY